MQYNIKKIALLSFFAALFMPAATYAATATCPTTGIQNLTDLIACLKDTLNSIIPLLFGIAVIVFIWGVIKYMAADGPQKLAEARNYIIFSIIAITIMLSVWGIALMLKNTIFPNADIPVGSSNLNNQLDPGNEMNVGG